MRISGEKKLFITISKSLKISWNMEHIPALIKILLWPKDVKVVGKVMFKFLTFVLISVAHSHKFVFWPGF